MSNKYRLTDDSKEAVRWRAANKRRVRKQNRRGRDPSIWLWIAVAVTALVSLPLAVVLACAVMYVSATQSR